MDERDREIENQNFADHEPENQEIEGEGDSSELVESRVNWLEEPPHKPKLDQLLAEQRAKEESRS